MFGTEFIPRFIFSVLPVLILLPTLCVYCKMLSYSFQLELIRVESVTLGLWNW